VSRVYVGDLLLVSLSPRVVGIKGELLCPYPQFSMEPLGTWESSYWGRKEDLPGDCLATPPPTLFSCLPSSEWKCMVPPLELNSESETREHILDNLNPCSWARITQNKLFYFLRKRKLNEWKSGLERTNHEVSSCQQDGSFSPDVVVSFTC
jgi:hypothetical protein